ncbi:MFS transporter [Limnochorda pilosa]|uniref:MFS transporter n=1 Tax=Limnochorda pilosa TaxID=1555112 RepID=A0A0K2SFK1_LIMPI|nr:MFS transporter [Limnochorda pilosa]BAS25878.1 MFS transporter [Limnochorda pilosa]
MSLRWGRTFLLGLGFFAITGAWALFNVQVPLYLRGFLEPAFPGQVNTLVGTFMILDEIAALFLEPYVGALSDRTRTRLGPRLPYVLVGMPLAGLAYLFLPYHTSLPLLIAFIVLFDFFMGIHRSPTVALMPDVTPEPLRSPANGVINLMGGLGGAVAFGVGALFLPQQDRIAFAIMGGVLLVIPWILLRFLREARTPLGWQERRSEEEPAGVLATARRLIRSSDRRPLALLFGLLLIWGSWNALNQLFSTYATVQLGMSSGAASQALLAAAAMLILLAIPGGLVGARLGRHRTMAGAGGLLVLVLAVAPLLGPGPALLAALGGVGILWAFIVVNAYPSVAALGRNVQTGAFTGLYYLFTTLGAILTPPALGALMDRFGEGFLFTGAALQTLVGVVLLWASAPRTSPVAAAEP